MKFLTSNYQKLFSLSPNKTIDRIVCLDHLGGFSKDLSNKILDKIVELSQHQNKPIEFHNSYIFDKTIQDRYPDIPFKYVFFTQFKAFQDYNVHPEINFQTFLCSFNGSGHVSRKLLVSILEKFGWFNPMTCSKNFSYTADILDGHLRNCLYQNQHRYYRKFFLEDHNDDFFKQLYSFGYVPGCDSHRKNIYNLETALTSSFLHIVSETMATSYYPFITEKFLYSVITRGLFLGYGQPGWHDYLERYYGFRLYNRIFDYKFDTIQNPVERLVELVSMIAKFSVLSQDDWRDLYEMELDTIEYNYDHYFSKNYLRHLSK